ncbi:hypothetical protein MON38_05440 [Hymenobacter sp. DH14]|uniref:DUF4468 domain-containing protein n=1 Tax=Hymenobacter cyanobacteriorum TaxID=2926463 RepID=A0A9X1VCZ6_9BACT|nr:hypothetical protein [Hymenobacter cyanobacteriorum]MCI1186854.1 hypothetical protein [Hymenobacter cyanobacteriorum]
MKKCICGLALLLGPLLASAQSGLGTYILVDNRTVVYKGDLDVSGRGLVARPENGKKQVWQASEVYWARIGNRRYLPVGGFQVNPSPRSRVEHGLAQVLDSGRVLLLRYDYDVGGGFSGMPGTNMVVNPTSTRSIYLLQVPAEDDALAIPMNLLSGKGPEFRQMLAPYFASRPDLIQQLESGVVARRNLPAFVHAFNTGQPFIPKADEGTSE